MAQFHFNIIFMGWKPEVGRYLTQAKLDAERAISSKEGEYWLYAPSLMLAGDQTDFDRFCNPLGNRSCFRIRPWMHPFSCRINEHSWIYSFSFLACGKCSSADFGSRCRSRHQDSSS